MLTCIEQVSFQFLQGYIIVTLDEQNIAKESLFGSKDTEIYYHVGVFYSPNNTIETSVYLYNEESFTISHEHNTQIHETFKNGFVGLESLNPDWRRHLLNNLYQIYPYSAHFLSIVRYFGLPALVHNYRKERESCSMERLFNLESIYLEHQYLTQFRSIQEEFINTKVNSLVEISRLCLIYQEKVVSLVRYLCKEYGLSYHVNDLGVLQFSDTENRNYNKRTLTLRALYKSTLKAGIINLNSSLVSHIAPQ